MLEKKRLLSYLLGTMLALSGCSSTVSPELRTTPIAGAQNPATLSKESYAEIASYSKRAEGEFATATGRIRWMNFTEFTINPRPLEQLFRFYQDWAAKSPMLRFPWQGETLTASFTKRPNRSVDLYLIPEEAPVPAGWVANRNAGTRVLYHPQGYEEAITIVRIYPPVTTIANDNISNVLNKDAESFLAIEACQASIRLDAAGADYRALQEVFCNSAGLASFMRKNNYPYALYNRLSGLVPMYDSAGTPSPCLTFSPDRYATFSSERIINP